MKGLAAAAISAAICQRVFTSAVMAQDQAALVKRGEYLVNGPMACANCHGTRAKDF